MTEHRLFDIVVVFVSVVVGICFSYSYLVGCTVGFFFFRHSFVALVNVSTYYLGSSSFLSSDSLSLNVGQIVSTSKITLWRACVYVCGNIANKTMIRLNLNALSETDSQPHSMVRFSLKYVRFE